jgi:hypothetical protein
MNTTTATKSPRHGACFTWQDMARFGINALTGEACAYGQRMLCDVNADGQLLLADYFGWQESLRLAPPMNSLVAGMPSVGSVMLPRDWRDLALFAHFREGAYGVYISDIDRSVVPIESEDRMNQYQAAGEHSGRLVRNPSIGSTQPHVGSRNVHAFTGRIL